MERECVVCVTERVKDRLTATFDKIYAVFLFALVVCVVSGSSDWLWAIHGDILSRKWWWRKLVHKLYVL